MGYYFIYSTFFCFFWQKSQFYLFFIDNGKGTQHFKFDPLDYAYSGVYLQKCKATGNPTLLLHQAFALKLVYQKMFECDLDLWPWWPILFSRCSQEIEFCNDTCTQNALWLNWWKLPAFHILVVQITIPCINQHNYWSNVITKKWMNLKHVNKNIVKLRKYAWQLRS